VVAVAAVGTAVAVDTEIEQVLAEWNESEDMDEDIQVQKEMYDVEQKRAVVYQQ
jgi:hypothetical protein